MRKLIAIGVVGLLLIVAGFYLKPSKKQDSSGARAQNAIPRGTQGQVSFIDPVTGLQREPSPAELQGLQPPAPSGPPQIIYSPVNGMMGLELTDDQMVYSVARKKADGKIAIDEARPHEKAPQISREVSNDR